MKVIPDNDYLLVREIETPTYSKIAHSKIINSEYRCGNVLDFAEGINPEYLDTNIIFLRAMAIPLRMKNDQGIVETRYLVKSEDVIAYLGE